MSNIIQSQINLTNEDRVRIKAPEITKPKKVKKLEVKQEVIPKSFVNHIRTLGFQDSDADMLYENKDDWIGISTGRLLQNVYK